MFQTEPILWLQTHGSAPLTFALSGVTLLGYVPVYVVLLLVLAFAVRLRPSLAVLGGVLLAGILTDAVKNTVEFPRPDEVDNRLMRTFATTPLPLAHRGGAASFWSLPAPAAIAAVRERAAGNYGFPSGHVGGATSFLLCAAWFFRSRRPLAFAAVWVPLMALSRLYLGRHFLADVLGGLVVGLVASGLAVLLFRALDERLFGRTDVAARPALVPPTLLALILLVSTPFVRLLNPDYVGGLVGLIVSYGFFVVLGLPRDGGRLRHRVLRVAVGALVFLAALAAMEALIHLVGPARGMTALGSSTLVGIATLVGTVVLSRRLGLYPGPPAAAARA